jgi:Uma2 family endonuclease
MVALAETTALMSVDSFLAWQPPDGRHWQLADGVPHAMAPANRSHGAIQAELGRLIGNHLADHRPACILVVAPGVVPRVLSQTNMRMPDLAVTCSAYQTEEAALSDPVLLIEILSPSNAAATWSNVWTYTTIPSVQDILVINAATIGADLLHRHADGTWPASPITRRTGDLVLPSIDFRVDLAAIYRTTRLAGGI